MSDDIRFPRAPTPTIEGLQASVEDLQAIIQQLVFPTKGESILARIGALESTPTTVVNIGVGGISQDDADARYLRLIGGELSGSLGIRKTPRVGASLDVLGPIVATQDAATPVEHLVFENTFAGSEANYAFRTSAGSLELRDNRAGQRRLSLAPDGTLVIDGPLFAPTPLSGDNSTRVATTAWVRSYVGAGGGSGGGGASDSDGLSVINQGAGTITRTLTEHLKDLTSAKTYGAVGDGVTDDTAALQAWLNAGGGYLPPGTYKITARLVLPANCRIVGAGAVSLIKLVLPDSTPVVPVIDSTSASSYVKLRDFAVDQNAAALAQNTCYGGDLGASSAIFVQGDHAHLTGLTISNSFGNGIFVVRYRVAYTATPADLAAAKAGAGVTYRGSPQHWVISDIKTVNCGLGNSSDLQKPGKNGSGIDIGSGSCGVLTNCEDYRSYTGFIIPDIGAGGSNTVSNLVAFYTRLDTTYPTNGSGTAFYIGDSNSQLSNLYAVAPEGHGFWLGGYCQYNQLSNAFVRFPGGHGFAIKGDSWQLTNCAVLNASQSTRNNIAGFTGRASAPYWDAFAVISNNNVNLTLSNCAAYGTSHAWGYSETKQTQTRTNVTTTSGLATLTMASTSALAVSMAISGTGIPAGATIVSIDSSTQITMSAPATANGTVTLTFTPYWETRAYGGHFEGLSGGVPTGAFATERLLDGVIGGISTFNTPDMLTLKTPYGRVLQIADQGALADSFFFIKGGTVASGKVQIGAYTNGSTNPVDVEILAYGATGAVRPNRLIPGYFETGNIYTPSAQLDVKTTGGGTAFRVQDTGVTPANYVFVKGSASGAVTQIGAWGTDTDVDLQVTLKTTASRFRAPTVPPTENSTAVATTAWVNSWQPVNLTMTGALTTTIVTAPASLLDLKTQYGSVLQITDTGATNTNWLVAKGTTTGAAQLIGWGSGANADLQLAAKGTGVIKGVTPGAGVTGAEVVTAAWVIAKGYATSAGSMIWPGAGIPNSTGSAWGTSYTTSGSGTVLALTDSPAFSGTPTAPTPLGTDNSTTLATTAWVKALGYLTSESDTLDTVVGRGASTTTVVTLGTNSALQASPGGSDNSTKIATTAWVQSQGYSTGAGGTSAIITLYSAANPGTGAHTLNVNTKAVYLQWCGGGGGGGGGASVASGTACSGGGGGGGAMLLDGWYRYSDFVSGALGYTLGGGGTGGNGAAAGGGAGSNGAGGGTTSITSGGVTLGQSYGGGGGAGGQVGANAGGGGSAGYGGAGGNSTGASAGSAGAFGGVAGGGSPGAFRISGSGAQATNALAGSQPGSSYNAHNGGGAGGGIATSPANLAGGNGGRALVLPTGSAPVGGTAGGGAGNNGTSFPGFLSTGGSGGGSNIAGAGGAGGTGGRGAGGGGGGSSGGTTPSTGGRGGDGGSGYLLIVEYVSS